MLIRLDGKYKTRDGRAVTIEEINLGSVYQVRGTLDGKPDRWTINGLYSLMGGSHLDLIEANSTDALIEQTCAAFAELRKNNGRVPAGKNLERVRSGNEWFVVHLAGEFAPMLSTAKHYRLVPIPAPVTPPESSRFKPGDRVRCVDDGGVVGVRNGGEYTVETVAIGRRDTNAGSMTRSGSRNCVTLTDAHGFNEGSHYDFNRFELVPPVPRFSVSADPCGVLDSQRPGMIIPCQYRDGAESIVKRLNAPGSESAVLTDSSFYVWQPLTRTVPLGPTDIIVGVTILSNAGGDESLVLSKTLDGVVYCSMHDGDANKKHQLFSATYEQLQDATQYSNDHGATFQPCEKQVPV